MWFLWWPDGDLDKKPQAYKMSVHLFDSALSLSSTNYGLKTADSNKEDFDAITIATIKQNFIERRLLSYQVDI